MAWPQKKIGSTLKQKPLAAMRSPVARPAKPAAFPKGILAEAAKKKIV